MRSLVKSSVLAVVLAVGILPATSGWGQIPERGDEVKFFAKPAPLPWRTVEFCYRLPGGRSLNRKAPLLVLVPGYNGSGSKMLAGWTEFADAEGFVLLAPTFQTSPEELKAERGYYYPDQWSGRVLEAAIAEVGKREGLDAGGIFFFGHSAGGHFAHRFTRWRPARVRAFVAGAAAWWGQPSAAMRGVPGLIVCGEDDPRLTASLEYFCRGLALGLPWIWRSYRNVGHTVPPAMRATAEAFLAHYARGETEGIWFGDIQTYAVTTDPEEIPEVVRVRLPSRAFAEVWRREE